VLHQAQLGCESPRSRTLLSPGDGERVDVGRIAGTGNGMGEVDIFP